MTTPTVWTCPKCDKTFDHPNAEFNVLQATRHALTCQHFSASANETWNYWTTKIDEYLERQRPTNAR